MADRFESYRPALDSPASKIAAIVSGTTFAAGTCRALLVGTAGTATVVDAEGNTATNIPLQVGYNPIRVSKVTLGTASNVWALF
ncbi:hypothetical protein [Bradyrhizobium liaoningense]|uniref:spike base protein, RCAP_Rcc01079 family n=1 Tax=Bradyrhizobium liaoningense TaxID=43992 RepID=UPI001BAA15AC|nr:hypothetical protein [Bradyrhizobium liaoningense]MBR0903360.1 hypothetical protein [Bradyrhizobium liaoningense]